jgi:gliding motility-associated-like protein
MAIKKTITLLLILTGLIRIQTAAQSVYINTQTAIYRLERGHDPVLIENGCGAESGILSIALQHDTIYYSTWNGELKRFRIGHPGTCETLIETGFVYNSMTVDQDGIIYAASDNLVRYDPYTRKLDELGFMPFYSSGDMIFYKDKLLMAGWDPYDWTTAIYELNIADPARSTVYMETPAFFGMLSMPVPCSKSRFFGLEPADAYTRLVELDLEKRAVIGVTDSIAANIMDGASLTETGVESKVYITGFTKSNPDNCDNDNGSITLKASSINGPLTFTLATTGIRQYTGRFTNLKGGSYRILATDTAGCSADTTIMLADNIPLPGCSDLFIPNAFTPNNDGRNDYFSFSVPAAFRDASVQVFGRWGNTVFAAKGNSFYWDGSYAGAKQPAGVYIYTFSYISPEGQRKNVKGTVTLLR